MTFDYSFLEFFVIAEIIIAILLVIVTIVMKIIYYFRKKRKIRLTKKADDIIQDALIHDKPITDNELPRATHRMDILQPLMEKYQNERGWSRTLETLSTSILLPLARKAIESRRWIKRCWAVKSFEVHREQQDEPHLEKLLSDKVPLIQFHAVWPSLQLGTETLVNTVITRTAEERRLAQSIFLEVFEQHQDVKCDYIVKRLNTEENPFIRATCYKILMIEKQTSAFDHAMKDTTSDNVELQLSAIRYVSMEDKPQVIDKLVGLLTAELPETRLTATRALGNLGASQTLPEVKKLLHDEKWWVRLDAVKTLVKFGPEGRQALHQIPETDEVYQLCQQVLGVKEGYHAR